MGVIYNDYITSCKREVSRLFSIVYGSVAFISFLPADLEFHSSISCEILALEYYGKAGGYRKQI